MLLKILMYLLTEKFNEEFSMEKILSIPLPVDYKGKITHSKPIKRLSFGKRKILLSDEEFEKLEALYSKYIDVYGVELGFIHYIISNLGEA